MKLNKTGFLLVDSLMMLIITCLIVVILIMMLQSFAYMNHRKDLFQNEQYAEILS